MRNAVVLLAVVATGLVGCAQLTATVRSVLPPWGMTAEPAPPHPPPTAEEITAQISELKIALLAEIDDPAREAELQHDMFSLQVNPRNEEPDYTAALAALERYAFLDPEGADRGEVRQWLRVLRELDRVRDDARTARNEARKARDDARDARATLERKLQELRTLDLDAERQRRGIR